MLLTGMTAGTAAAAAVLAALAVWAIAAWIRGRGVAAGWGPVAMVAWPAAQLIRWPESVLAWLAPERAAELARFRAAGVEAAPAISLYPWATLQTLIALAATAALYVLAREATRRRPATRYGLLAAIALLGVAEALLGWRQYLFGQSGVAALAELRGTFGNRNLLAAWLVGCYGAALGWWGASRRRSRAAAAACTGVLAATVVATLSRGGTAALAGATAVFTAGRAGARRAAAVAAVAAALSAAAVGAGALAARCGPEALSREREGRLAMWQDALAAAAERSPAGAGAGAFAYGLRRSRPYLAGYSIDHAHCDYLDILVEAGLPGAFLTGGLLWTLARRIRKAKGAAPRGALAGAAGVLLQAAVDFPLHIPAVAALAALLLGLGSGAARRRPRWTAAATAAVAAALSATACFIPRLASWNAEEHYRAGWRAFEAGHETAAERAFRRGLAANPYAGPLWMEMAFLAEARGEREAALRYTALAEEVEPHSGRIAQAAMNLRLRLEATARR